MKVRALLVCAVALALAASPALAHVSVTPQEVSRGSGAQFRFTVPNEEADANTTKVEIFLPEGVDGVTPEYPAAPAWTFHYVDGQASVEFSSGKIEPGQKLDFVVNVRKLPASGDTLVFKVLQTYDNGEVVRWIDIPAGSAEPPHPAPIVRLSGAAPATTIATTTTTAPAREERDGSGAPLILLAALFVAGVGGGIALFSLVSRRRRA